MENLEKRMTVFHIREWMGTFTLAVLVVSGSAASQGAGPDSLVLRADSLRLVRQFDAAEETYRLVIDQNDSSRAAWAGLGALHLAQQQWGDAVDCYDRLSELSPDDLSSRLALAISYRELGTTKASLLRTVNWNTSRDLFEAVIERDSSFLDALYQYAILQQYRDDYPSAIALGHLQIAKKPNLSSARLGLFKLYRQFVANDRASAIAWLEKRQLAITQYFLGEARRREGRLDLAEARLLDLLFESRTPLSQPICLSLARIAAKKNLPAVVEAYVTRAIDELLSPLGADLLFEDIKYIVSDLELDEYASLTTVEQKATFFRAFWAARNPTGGVSNPRIVEHYRRLVSAEENYEYTGFRTRFTDPDRMKYLSFPRCYSLNREFNDKGLVLLRHGDPDNVLRSRADLTDPQESWLYETSGESPRRIFHFAKVNAPGNNWRLTALPSDEGLIGNLTLWDTRYSNLLGTNSSATLKMVDELTAEMGSSVRVGLSTDNHTWEKAIRTFVVPHSADAFRSTDGRALVDISCGIPIEPLLADVIGNTQLVYAETAVAIRSLTKKSAFTFADTIPIPLSGVATGYYTHLFRYRIPSDAYSISMHIRPIGTTSYGSWNIRKEIPVFSSTALEMSDIQFLIPARTTSELEFDGIKVAPSPFTSLPHDKPLYTYVHIYNLSKDAEGKSAYNARYYFAPGNQTASASPVAQSLEITPEDVAAEFKKIDVSGFDPGTYKLTIEITDRKSGHTVRTSRSVQVFEP
jgi:GWxTD domain-containing protein